MLNDEQFALDHICLRLLITKNGEGGIKNNMTSGENGELKGSENSEYHIFY